MKNDTTFVRMRSGDHLGDAKMSKMAPRSVKFNFIIDYDRQKRFLQNERKRADLPKYASDFLRCHAAFAILFCAEAAVPGVSYEYTRLSP